MSQTRSACHIQSPTPGYAERLMTVEQAYKRVIYELNRRPQLQVVAVSGPGEPLYNRQTLQLFDRIRQADLDVHLCLSTNGVLLSQYAQRLSQLCIETVSVSVHACHVDTAAEVYEWAITEDNRTLRGSEMGEYILQSQLQGIEHATEAGLHVKVNTVLIPGINEREIATLARLVRERGASIQNLMPLRINEAVSTWHAPTTKELATARCTASAYIPQFHLCAGCRSDVVGVPGTDAVL